MRDYNTNILEAALRLHMFARGSAEDALENITLIRSRVRERVSNWLPSEDPFEAVVLRLCKIALEEVDTCIHAWVQYDLEKYGDVSIQAHVTLDDVTTLCGIGCDKVLNHTPDDRGLPKTLVGDPYWCSECLHQYFSRII